MAEFAYKATDSTGSPTSGRLTAHSRGEAYRLLRERGLQPVSVSSADGSPDPSKKTPTSDEPLPRLNTTQLLYFTEELAELLEAGRSTAISLPPAKPLAPSPKSSNASALTSLSSKTSVAALFPRCSIRPSSSPPRLS
jgi:type II secretory pathway component PulF